MIKSWVLNNLEKLKRTDFFSVVMSSVLVKIIAFCGGMFLVRILTKEEYGIYAYVLNTYGMMLLIGDLGGSVAALQFCNEAYNLPEKRDDFFSYGLRFAFLGSILCSFLLMAAPLYYPFTIEEAIQLTASLFLVPFVTNFNGFLVTNLRIKLLNKKYSMMNFLSSLITYMVLIPFSVFWGLRGAILSNYFVAISIFVLGIFLNRGELKIKRHVINLKKEEKKEFCKLAILSQLNNGVDHVLLLMDTFLIGLFVASSVTIASYKVATTLPSALMFIPSSIMVYSVPYFARKYGDLKWVKNTYAKLLIGIGGLNILITASCILLAPIILPLIFGTEYSDSILCFRILMVGYFFTATFRIPASNVIYTQHAVKMNLVITISSGILNPVLDIILINKWGSVGAAIATMTVNVVSSCMALLCLCFVFRKNSRLKCVK